MFQRFFAWDVVGTRGARQRRKARGRDALARGRHSRPGVESLEGRQLLAALTEFPLSSDQSISASAALTAGPDGNLWFPVEGQIGGVTVVGEIERITPAGELTNFPLPATYSSPSALTVGPDGNLWFTNTALTFNGPVPAVGQITPAGVITEYPTHSSYSSESALTVGPEGNLWFTESTPSSSGGGLAASVGRITTAGVISEFPLPATNNDVSGLTDGPDGNLWFSASTSNGFGSSAPSSFIGRITPAGVISEFGLPSIYSSASALTTGPDGNLWFSNQPDSLLAPFKLPPAAIGRITPTGTLTEYPLSSTVNIVSALTVGPDGNLWFNDYGEFAFGPDPQIGQITPAGAITQFPLAPGFPANFFSGLTVGPDKNLYFTSSVTGDEVNLAGTGSPGAVTIGRITASGTVLELTGAARPPSEIPFMVYAPTVGADGNLWFPDGSNVGRLDPAQVTLGQAIPLGVLSSPIATHSKKGITSIVLQFDEPMNPASASTAAFYSVGGGVKKHHMPIYSKAVKIRSVTYDATAGTATLRLAKPFEAKMLQVTIHGGILATNGTSTQGDATTIAS